MRTNATFERRITLQTIRIFTQVLKHEYDIERRSIGEILPGRKSKIEARIQLILNGLFNNMLW